MMKQYNAGAGQFLNLLAFGALPLVPPLSGIILSHLAVLLVCSNRQRRPLHPGKLAIRGEEAAIGRKEHPLPDVSGGQQLSGYKARRGAAYAAGV